MRTIKVFGMIIFLLLGVLVFQTVAFRIARPPKISLPLTSSQVNKLNDYLENLWQLQQGEFNLDIVSTTKSNAGNGDFWIYTGTTAAIEYKANGTIYRILAQEADDTNYVEIEPDGTVVLNGSATVWEDIRVPAQNTVLNPSKSEPALEQFVGNVYAYAFDTSNADDESVHFIAQLPHSLKSGSSLYPHIHWSPDNTDTGNVVWELEYAIANVDDVFSSTTVDTITVPADGVSHAHQLDDFSPISLATTGLSAIIDCRLTRMSSTDAADTFTGNAFFLEFDFHYEMDTLGSRDLTDK